MGRCAGFTMKFAPGLFVQIGAEIRGPYDVEQLRQLAEVEVITPATEAAETATGPWTKLEMRTERAAVFPSRAQMKFKATEFAVKNRDSETPLDHRDMIAAANLPPPATAGAAAERFAAAEADKKSTASDEVGEMVREVARRHADFAPPPPPPKRRRWSRRLKLVAVLAVVGNAVLAAIPVAYGAMHDGQSMMMVGGWAVLYNGAMAMLYFSMPRD
jgi:hypothetical protein